MPEQPLSRRQLLTDALPRGLAQLAGGLLKVRTDLADLAGLSDPHQARIRAQSRELDEIMERERREHPEWFVDLPDLSNPQAMQRHLDELEERARQWRREHPQWFGGDPTTEDRLAQHEDAKPSPAVRKEPPGTLTDGTPSSAR
jgi:hypothetical protein